MSERDIKRIVLPCPFCGRPAEYIDEYLVTGDSDYEPDDDLYPVIKFICEVDMETADQCHSFYVDKAELEENTIDKWTDFT